MTIKKLLCLTTLSAIQLQNVSCEIQGFRLPDKKFVTNDKKALLQKKELSYFMPLQTARDILRLKEGQTKKDIDVSNVENYYNQGFVDRGTSFGVQINEKFPDFNHKKDIEDAVKVVKILEATTVHDAKKLLGLDKVEPANLENKDTQYTFWESVGNIHKRNARDRIGYWLIYEKENLMHKDEALNLLGITDDKLGQEQTTRDIVEKAYISKTGTLAPADKKFDDYDRARRTLRALSIPNWKTAEEKGIGQYNSAYSYKKKITDENFNDTLEELDEGTQTAFKEISKGQIVDVEKEIISIAHDRILYDMLEQINYWKKPALTVKPGTPTPPKDLPTALKNLSDSLDNLQKYLAVGGPL